MHYELIVDITNKLKIIRKLQSHIKNKKLFQKNIERLYLPLKISCYNKSIVTSFKKELLYNFSKNYKKQLEDTINNNKFIQILNGIKVYIHYNLFKTIYHYSKLQKLYIAPFIDIINDWEIS